eukprot:GHVT01028915.1.p1 GENE.GHVT01028915.1~~GHVT01028915.1.p1  ORF type:complete len:207 (+),score=39.15 GHVT01028915.1:845-1465(+)
MDYSMSSSSAASSVARGVDLASSTLSCALRHPAFNTLVFYSGALALKTVAMAPLTIAYRFKTCSFHPEDSGCWLSRCLKGCCPSASCGPSPPGGPSSCCAPSSEGASASSGAVALLDRIRRSHANDLENIPLTLITAFFFLQTNPSEKLAKNIFRAFALSRLVFTIGHLTGIHPLRGAGFMSAFACTLYLIRSNILYCLRQPTCVM